MPADEMSMNATTHSPPSPSLGQQTDTTPRRGLPRAFDLTGRLAATEITQRGRCNRISKLTQR
jgi:hypothetical protein